MLNVSWEHKDLSFNADGYLTNPSMVIIALDRERHWDKVSLMIRWNNNNNNAHHTNLEYGTYTDLEIQFP